MPTSPHRSSFEHIGWINLGKQFNGFCPSSNFPCTATACRSCAIRSDSIRAPSAWIVVPELQSRQQPPPQILEGGAGDGKIQAPDEQAPPRAARPHYPGRRLGQRRRRLVRFQLLQRPHHRPRAAHDHPDRRQLFHSFVMILSEKLHDIAALFFATFVRLGVNNTSMMLSTSGRTYLWYILHLLWILNIYHF